MLGTSLQSVTITLGGLAFFADGVYSIVTFYAATEANSFRESFWIAYCLIMTITLLAGAGSVISLAHTTFEDSVATLLFIHGNRNSTVADNSSTAVDEVDTCNTNFLDMEHSRDFSAHRFT
ncbi:unnamed protein product [Tilletia controversa]|nr:unnamed protein product [Tilletia controversa]